MMALSVFAEAVPMAGVAHGSVSLAMVTGGEVAVVAIVFGSIAGVLTPLFRAVARRIDNKSVAGRFPVNDIEERLDRIERAVDSIALEVERVSEGQRFVTKLLADKASSSLPAGNK